MLRLAACLACTLILAACAAEDGGGALHVDSYVSTRDSAGHIIVESTAPAWSEDSRWSVAAVPLIRIGAVEGDPAAEFTRIIRLFLLHDGGVAVADFGPHEVRYFDAAGRHVATAGGQGGGPGEFGRLREVLRGRGDTLVVHDPTLDRYTVLAPDGSLARTVSDSRLVTAVVGERWVAARRLPGAVPDVLGTIVQDTVALVAFTPGAATEDTLGLHPADASFYAEATMGGNTSRSVFPLPYAPSLVVTGNGERVVLSHGRTFELLIYGRAASAPQHVRRPGQRTPITAADREAFLDFRYGPRLAAGYIGTAYADAPFPDSAGTFDRVIVAADGPLWARHYVMPGHEARTWSIFAANGMWLGEVSTPAELDVMDVAYGRLAGVRRNELDVPFVEVYDLHEW